MEVILLNKVKYSPNKKYYSEYYHLKSISTDGYPFPIKIYHSRSAAIAGMKNHYSKLCRMVEEKYKNMGFCIDDIKYRIEKYDRPFGDIMNFEDYLIKGGE